MTLRRTPLFGCILSRARGLVLVCAFLGLALFAPATGAAVTPGTPEQLHQIEDYLNNLKTVKARFLQATANGGISEGDVYISRPGRMRIEYDPPNPSLIIADGTFLIYFDKQLEQVSYLPLGSTPASVLLDKKISFDPKTFNITEFDSDAGAIRLGLERRDSPGEGSITLVFEAQPLSLKQWTVVDSQGMAVTFSLLSAEFNMPVDKELFHFRNPKFFRDEFK